MCRYCEPNMKVVIMERRPMYVKIVEEQSLVIPCECYCSILKMVSSDLEGLLCFCTECKHLVLITKYISAPGLREYADMLRV